MSQLPLTNHHFKTKNMLYSRIEGEGEPLLILHGFLGMSDNWKTIGGQFAEQGYQVHIPDMRNHGRSFHSDTFNYEVMVADLFEYCEQHHLDTVNIIGHSMGGKIAMFFAVSHPEKINKLIIADIGPKYYAPHHQAILAGLSAVDFSEKPSRNDVEDVLKEYINDFGTCQFLMKNLYWETPGQLAFRFNLNVFLQNTEAIGAALPENAVYKKETLFLRGEKSDYIKEADVDMIQYHFPDSEIKTIHNAGHWLHAENPKDFFNLVVLFLKK